MNWKLSVIKYFRLFVCLFSFLMKILMAFFFFFFFFKKLNLFSCLSALLLFPGLSALFLRPASSCACSFVFLHDVDSKAYLAAALWYCGFCEALAVVLGSRSCAYIPLFPLFLPCNLYLPVSSVSLSSRALGPHLHCTVVLYFCNHAIYSPAGLWFCVVLFPWGFSWSLGVL